MVSIRIPLSVRDEVKALAKEKRQTMSGMLSRIVRLYREKGDESAASNSDVLKRIETVINTLSFGVTKISGSAERTESFIKTLLGQDRPTVPNTPVGSASVDSQVSDYDDSAVSVLSSLLGGLLDKAARTKNFDGTQAMQIRLSMDEFTRIRNQYEQACTSRNS